jgi:hypothetical protein
MQAANPFLDLGSLTTAGQRVTALVLALAIWVLAWLLGMRAYVPYDEARTRRKMEAL